MKKTKFNLVTAAKKELKGIIICLISATHMRV